MQAIDQFFDFLERSEHALVNLNPLFALMPTYMHFMPLFVHTVLSPLRLLHSRLPPYDEFRCRRTSGTDMLKTNHGPGTTSSLCVPRAQIARQKIRGRHRNDRHHEILADALR